MEMVSMGQRGLGWIGEAGRWGPAHGVLWAGRHGRVYYKEGGGLIYVRSRFPWLPCVDILHSRAGGAGILGWTEMEGEAKLHTIGTDKVLGQALSGWRQKRERHRISALSRCWCWLHSGACLLSPGGPRAVLGEWLQAEDGGESGAWGTLCVEILMPGVSGLQTQAWEWEDCAHVVLASQGL